MGTAVADAGNCPTVHVVLRVSSPDRVARQAGVRVLYRFDAAGLSGFAARLTDAQRRRIQRRAPAAIFQPERSRFRLVAKPGYEDPAATSIPECPRAPIHAVLALGETYDFFPHWLAGPNCREFWATLSARQLYLVSRSEVVERLSPEQG
jgi:hypothetical protein